MKKVVAVPLLLVIIDSYSESLQYVSKAQHYITVDLKGIC